MVSLYAKINFNTLRNARSAGFPGGRGWWYCTRNVCLQKCAYTRLCCSSNSRVVEMNGRLRSYSSESDSANGHQPSSSEKRLTICVVGSGGVGKSSLTVRYLQGHFPEVSSCFIILCSGAPTVICYAQCFNISRGVSSPISHLSLLLSRKMGGNG